MQERFCTHICWMSWSVQNEALNGNCRGPFGNRCSHPSSFRLLYRAPRAPPSAAASSFSKRWRACADEAGAARQRKAVRASQIAVRGDCAVGRFGGRGTARRSTIRSGRTGRLAPAEGGRRGRQSLKGASQRCGPVATLRRRSRFVRRSSCGGARAAGHMRCGGATALEASGRGRAVREKRELRVCSRAWLNDGGHRR